MVCQVWLLSFDLPVERYSGAICIGGGIFKNDCIIGTNLFQSEISLLLREIDNLGDELSRKRGSEFVEAATQTHARMASMEQLHNATDKLETAVKLSIDLKQHNDHLKKVTSIFQRIHLIYNPGSTSYNPYSTSQIRYNF